MIKSVLAFFALGFLFGFLADINALISIAFKNKYFLFILDATMLICFGILFFCLAIIFNSGSLRGVFFLSCFAGVIVYFATLFKLFNKPRTFVAQKLKKLANLILLNLKKLLHSNK